MKAIKFPLLYLGMLGLFLVFASCAKTESREVQVSNGPADPNATTETKALFANLKKLAKDHVLYGHQDDLAYGVKWINEPGRSDVKEVAGSYPAVYGWEVGDIGNEGATENLDHVNFNNMREWIKQGYQRGGLITMSWHMDNPVTDGDAWDTTRAAPQILPGGKLHKKFTDKLDRFAAFIKTLKTDDGTPIPIIFRPFHEHTGSWFWWGAGNITPENYKKLYSFTLDYLRNKKGIHNLLIAYSPSGPGNHGGKEAFWNFYPGNDYVDIIGFDSYFHFSDSVTQDEIRQNVSTLGQHLGWVVRQAEQRGKIPAFTETGLNTIPIENFWTDILLKAIKSNPDAKRIAYVLTWRNANENRMKGHYFAPYPGQKSAENFKKFTDDPLILLENELPDMYKPNN